VVRHREIAASPVRTAAETWAVIRELIATTLDRSDHIDGDHVRGVLDAAAPAGVALIAAGYTNTVDLIVVAGPLHLTIRTVAGPDAFKIEADENLNPVPGAATASAWMMHLPKPAGLASLIEEAIDASQYLSAEPPPTEVQTAKNSAAATIDLRRLDPSRRT